MLPPIIHLGDLRHPPDSTQFPDWFIRDMGERLVKPPAKPRWRLPIWPGLRLELRVIPATGAEHV